jgi:hypothetical protein
MMRELWVGPILGRAPYWVDFLFCVCRDVLWNFKGLAFSDVTPCGPAVHLRFGESNSNPSNQQEISLFASCWLLSCLTLRHWRWKQYVPPKRRTLSEPHSITSQNCICVTVWCSPGADVDMVHSDSCSLKTLHCRSVVQWSCWILWGQCGAWANKGTRRLGAEKERTRTV